VDEIINPCKLSRSKEFPDVVGKFDRQNIRDQRIYFAGNLPMDTPEKRRQLQALGEEIFELTKIVSKARAQAHRGDAVETLTETEHVTLDLLSKKEVMSVGEIQKSIGVLPAQMSRIVRTLEDKSGGPYILCSINPRDRRKIDVSISEEGTKALETYRAARMAMIVRTLSILDPEERESFMAIIRKIRQGFANTPKNK
jgi:MarR family 2-MHQ and catechol resistance regulon transcriptional repressor